MNSVKLAPGDFSGFIQRSVVGAELLTLTVREINRDSDSVMNSELVDMIFQLCVETLIKHRLSHSQLMRVDVLDFVSTTSSPTVRNFFENREVKDDLEKMLFDFDVKFVKMAMCLVMARMALGKKRDIAQELSAEYEALTT